MTESTGSNEHNHELSNFGNNSTAMVGPCWTLTSYESSGSNKHNHELSIFGNSSTAIVGPCWTMTNPDFVISKPDYNLSYLFHLLFSILGPYQGNFCTIFWPCLVSIEFKVAYQYQKLVVFI